ncbi:MAG: hypothetical protein K2P81_05115 [Bacteriovoracaceae bacterium]|nr:hypothetical protein [Bacteriovoracaceae bacterium]
MADNRCFLCKFLGDHTTDTSKNYLYLEHDRKVAINLCHSHSVELFKNGQESYFKKYRKSLMACMAIMKTKS